MIRNPLLDLISYTEQKSRDDYILKIDYNWCEAIMNSDAKCLLWNFIDNANIAVQHPSKKICQVYGKILRAKILNELHILSNLFIEHSIPFLVLKGIPMEYIIYNKKVYRDTSDIDLLIPPDAIEPALQLLQENGYHFVDNVHQYQTITLQQALKLYTRHIVAEKDQLSVEIHCQFHYYKKDRLIGNNQRLLTNYLLYDSHKIVLNNNELHEIPTLDICDSMILVTNHIYFELQAHLLQKRHRYPLKLFVDSLFLMSRIKEANLYNILLERSESYNYRLGLQMVLLHINHLFDWYDETAWNLFNLEHMSPYLDTIHLDNCELCPIGEWNVPLYDRFFNYSEKDMTFYIR